MSTTWPRLAEKQARDSLVASRTTLLGLVKYRGNRRGPLPLRWVRFHVLRELARRRGHADILCEQILSEQRARDRWPMPHGVP